MFLQSMMLALQYAIMGQRNSHSFRWPVLFTEPSESRSYLSDYASKKFTWKTDSFRNREYLSIYQLRGRGGFKEI